MAVFPDGGDSGTAVVAPWLVADLLFPDIHCRLYLVISADYSFQVAVLDDWEQEELMYFRVSCIFYVFCVVH